MRGGENRGRGEKEEEREDNVQCTYSSYCCISIKKKN